MPVRYMDSTKKIFEYFRRVENYRVYLSPLFFRSLICLPSCGACCPVFSLDWFLEERRSVLKQQGVVNRVIEYNGCKVEVSSIIQEGNSHYRFLDNSARCIIHNQRPLSCRIEPIKTKLVRNTVYILRQKFGRGWNMTRVTGEKGCLCGFGIYNADTWQEDVDLCNQLAQVGMLFGLELAPIRALGQFLLKHKHRVINGEVPNKKIWLNNRM